MKSFGKTGEETIYFKLNEDTKVISGPSITLHEDKWYFLNMKELEEKSNFLAKENKFDIKKIAEEIRELNWKYEMIKFQEDLGDTSLGAIGYPYVWTHWGTLGEMDKSDKTVSWVDEQEVYHYQVGIDSEALLGFYTDILKIMSSEIASTEAGSDFEDFETELEKNKKEILTIMDEILDNVKTEVFIGKEDKRIYKIAINGKFDRKFMEELERKMKKIEKEKYPELYNESEENNMVSNNTGDELSFNISMVMTNFNQPVKIDKPKDAGDLMKIFEEAVMGFTGGTALPIADPNLDSDKDGLSDALEDVYKTDKNNPDTDGDGYLDGNEVENGYDPLVPGSAKLDYGKMFERKK